MGKRKRERERNLPLIEAVGFTDVSPRNRHTNAHTHTHTHTHTHMHNFTHALAAEQI